MFVPFFTRRSESQSLGRRKGGGSGGKTSGGSGGGTSGESGGGTSGGSGSTGSSGGSSTSKGGTPSNSGSGSKGGGSTSSGGKTSGSTGGSSGKTTSVPLSGTSTASGKNSAYAYGFGGGKSVTIPSGQLFAGRSAGGGTRSQVYGTRTYGSGYPGVVGRGVGGRGFPFWFWPVVWGGYGVPPWSYLHDSEYGTPSNTSRLGGPMTEATFISNSTSTTFHVLSDNSTITSLITTIDANCSLSLASSSSQSPQTYNSSDPGAPLPEQAIQYYRASSIVLTLDGYNNSAVLSNDTNVTDSPLPSGIDMTLLDCLNQTIAMSAPLVSGAGTQWPTGPSSASLLGMVWLVWYILSLL